MVEKKTELWVVIAGIVATVAAGLLEVFAPGTAPYVVSGIVAQVGSYVAGRTWKKTSEAKHGIKANESVSLRHEMPFLGTMPPAAPKE